MLKIIGGIAGVIVLAAAVVVAIAATKPDRFQVTRSIDIAAPPEAIYVHIDDFPSWRAWSPFEKADPDMARLYGGPASGPGATYAWESEKFGTGRMEIVKVEAARLVEIRLDFIKPFIATNTATFTLAPEGERTRVTWTMAGPNSFVSKLMSVFFSMDAMIGKDFEAGLSDLKAISEKPANSAE